MRGQEKYRLHGGVGGLTTRVLGRPILIAGDTASTNDDAKHMVENRLISHGALLMANSQSSGKGRLGRQWLSPQGGVFMSLVLQPGLSPARMPAASLVAGYALALALREDFGLDAKVKWPNDVLIGGKKLSGILCEMKAGISHIHYVIVGVGVNVNIAKESLPSDIEPNATSMSQELGGAVDETKVVSCFLNRFEPVYDRFISIGLSSLAGKITSIAAYLGEPVVISRRTGAGGHSGKDEEGLFSLIDGSGRIVLDQGGGIMKAVEVGDLSLRQKPETKTRS